jgi:hypothetical protein
MDPGNKVHTQKAASGEKPISCLNGKKEKTKRSASLQNTFPFRFKNLLTISRLDKEIK